jgi:hypothetical protein
MIKRAPKFLTLLLVVALLLSVEKTLGCTVPPVPKLVIFSQVDSNAPLSPAYRMCSNAEIKYRDATFGIVISGNDPSYTVTAVATGTVRFPGGSQFQSGLTNGSQVTLSCQQGAYGNWTLGGEVAVFLPPVAANCGLPWIMMELEIREESFR